MLWTPEKQYANDPLETESQLEAKRANSVANVSARARKIDDRVCRRYGLSKDQIKIVKEASE
jgi:hypothetical protein